MPIITNPINYNQEPRKMTESKKFDSGKDRWDLLPLWVLSPVVKVLTFGSLKYGPNNWQNLVDFEARYTAAFLRHFVAWQSGEKIDPESGQAHIAHMICNLIFILWKEQTNDPHNLDDV